MNLINITIFIPQPAILSGALYLNPEFHNQCATPTCIADSIYFLVSSTVKSVLHKGNLDVYWLLKKLCKTTNSLDKGEFQGIPILGRNTLWVHYKPVMSEIC